MKKKEKQGDLQGFGEITGTQRARDLELNMRLWIPVLWKVHGALGMDSVACCFCSPAATTNMDNILSITLKIASKITNSSPAGEI